MLKGIPRGRALILAPHPDDETLACGGTIALHRKRGDDVRVIFLTDGGAGDPKGYFRGRDLAAMRRREATRACALLGGAKPEFWNFEDGRLASARDLGDRLRRLLSDVRPAVVYRPSPRDPHRDHRALARAFDQAARGSAGIVDLTYEVCFLQKPTRVVDVGSVFDSKRRALKQYRSQLRYRDYVAIAERTALLRGLFLERPGFAEAFAE